MSIVTSVLFVGCFIWAIILASYGIPKTLKEIYKEGFKNEE